MQYSEFIKQPQIESRFNSMFDREIEYYKEKFAHFGIKNERVNSVAIKMASVSTDIYFTELHKQLDKDK